MIKKYKKDKQDEENRKMELEMKKRNAKANRLKKEMLKRQVEIGIPSNIGGVKQEITALIMDPSEAAVVKKFKNPMDQ